MDRKIIILLAIFFIAFPLINLHSNDAVQGEENYPPFDYESYEPITIRNLNDEFKNYETRVGPGLGANIIKYRVNISLKSYPVPIDEDSQSTLELWGKLFTVNRDYLGLFNRQITFKDDDFTYVLLIQDSLVPHIHEELEIDDPVELYLIFGTFNTFGKKFTLMVNEFQKIKMQRT